MKYEELIIEVIRFTNVDVITSSYSCERETKWEKRDRDREREEELEDDYDEYEGIEDPDF